MKAISIINLKGGTGKTTTAVNMAYMLAEEGNRVLVIDNDKQANATKLYLSNCFDVDEENGLYEVLTGEKNIRDCLYKSRYAVDVVPSGVKLRLADIRLEQRTDIEKYFVLRNALEEVASNYDYVLIDNPPDVNATVFNALVASDEVIITVSTDGYSIDGANKIRETVLMLNEEFNTDIKIVGVLQTNSGRNKISCLTRDILKEFNYKVFENYIRASCKVPEANGMYKPLELHAPKANVTKDYRAFLREYKEITK